MHWSTTATELTWSKATSTLLKSPLVSLTTSFSRSRPMSDEEEGRERSRGKDREERKWEELGLEEREWRVSRRGGGSGGRSRGREKGWSTTQYTAHLWLLINLQLYHKIQGKLLKAQVPHHSCRTPWLLQSPCWYESTGSQWDTVRLSPSLSLLYADIWHHRAPCAGEGGGKEKGIHDYVTMCMNFTRNSVNLRGVDYSLWHFITLRVVWRDSQQNPKKMLTCFPCNQGLYSTESRAHLAVSTERVFFRTSEGVLVFTFHYGPQWEPAWLHHSCSTNYKWTNSSELTFYSKIRPSNSSLTKTNRGKRQPWLDMMSDEGNIATQSRVEKGLV